jgi:hypothetical protein
MKGFTLDGYPSSVAEQPPHPAGRVPVLLTVYSLSRAFL